MTDLNHVVLIGRLTKDLGSDERSFGYVQQGIARANVDIAVNRSKKQGDLWIEEVSYFQVTIWGRTAENLKPYLVKGKQICVEGFLKQDRWEKDGQKQSRIAIVAENVQLLGGNSENQNGAPRFEPQQSNGYQNGYSQPQSQFAQQYQNQQNNAFNGYVKPNTTAGAPQNSQPQNDGGVKEDIPWDNDIPF